MSSSLFRPFIAAVAVGSLLALSACGNDASSTADSATTPSAAPDPAPEESSDPAEPTAPASSAVPDILAFDATTVDGEPFDARTLAGRPVVVWFWAPWCAVCRSQIGDVRALADEYDDLAVIGVGSLDSTDAIAGFASDVPGVTHLSDESGDVWKRFGITEQSSFVVLDAEGQEVLRTGYSDDDAVADAVADLAG